MTEYLICETEHETVEEENECEARRIYTEAEATGAMAELVAAQVLVPKTGTFLVIDGVVHPAAVDTTGYAGPQVHLVTTEGELT